MKNKTPGRFMDFWNQLEVVSAYGQIVEQRDMWADALREHSGSKPYGYDWGDPESHVAVNMYKETLGDYKKILDEYLLKNIQGKTVVDLGSLSGKWTQFMVKGASKIICADLNEDGFNFIRKNILMTHPDQIDYMLVNGYDLSGLKDGSVDYIFCMDCLGRSHRPVLNSYFMEFRRVLADNGKLCIHLPCSNQELSCKFEFTHLPLAEIEGMVEDSGLDAIGNITIDTTTINHGVLLLLNINAS